MEAKTEDTTTTIDTSLNTSVGSTDAEEEFTEEELKRAEEYKSKGNEAFKSKFRNPSIL
jgi:hypothetical protein